MNINKFYDFSTGKPISEQLKQKIIKEVYEKLKAGLSHWHVQCGNFLVVGIKYNTEISIFVSENYFQYTETIEG